MMSMTHRESTARAAKAIALLDTLAAHVAPAPLIGDAVRMLPDDAWKRAEYEADVRPSSEATRELVAHLADRRYSYAARNAR